MTVADIASEALFVAALVVAALGAILTLAGLVALLRARPLRFTIRTTFGMLLLAAGALAGSLAVGLRGYHALTREEIAAHVTVKPLGLQRFSASFRFPDGREAAFELAGDEIYVDARLIKWKPIANVVGLHTVYELDRVAGRYHSLDEERSARRTVYALGREKPIDLFSLRRRYELLAPLFDAEYGSATFVPVTRAAELELRVSTTGLLIRETGLARDNAGARPAAIAIRGTK